jgi:hypothetical protein
VLQGLFRVIETLFAVRIRPDTAPVWHEDVRFFRIEDAAGGLVGQFYLDLYARDTKRGGAWMDDAITRRNTEAGIQTPVAYLNCNFSRPVGNKPALFTHDEVITLFHETGHGLHHLLTRVEELGVSGINGVEWDAVELPSQFMENFCWEWEVLAEMTAHVDTGEPLPRALFDRMTAAKNFQGGMQIVRQLEFSLFDLLLHSDFEPAGQKSVLDLIEEVRKEVAVIFPPPWHRFPNSFSHIFSGGYAAGYYSYKWAEVLSADAFAAFEEEGATAACSTRPPASASATRSSPSAAAARRWTPSRPSAAARPASMPCCGTAKRLPLGGQAWSRAIQRPAAPPGHQEIRGAQRPAQPGQRPAPLPDPQGRRQLPGKPVHQQGLRQTLRRRTRPAPEARRALQRNHHRQRRAGRSLQGPLPQGTLRSHPGGRPPGRDRSCRALWHSLLDDAGYPAGKR